MNHNGPRPLTLFIAMSLDGYIAGPDDDLSFLSMVELPGEDYGYEAFTETVDTVIMGRKTYDKVRSFGIEFPHRDRKCYVFSNSRSGSDDHVEFYSGSPENLIRRLKEEKGKGIYCDGGARLAQQLIRLDMMDKYVISIIPVLLGKGVKLFEEHPEMLKLHLEYVKSFPSGLVQLCYSRRKE
jgi:dihydrofolate reductase